MPESSSQIFVLQRFQSRKLWEIYLVVDSYPDNIEVVFTWNIFFADANRSFLYVLQKIKWGKSCHRERKALWKYGMKFEVILDLRFMLMGFHWGERSLMTDK